jgi:2-keto-3-deoxy-L-rhamnonate aldolase RhmA
MGENLSLKDSRTSERKKKEKINLENSVKTRLKSGRPSVSTWVEMPHPDIAEQLAMEGFDWLVFDVEHGLFTFPQLQMMMQAIAPFPDCLPMVRVPINDPVYFKWALDVGAKGIVVPMVNNKEEAERAVRSSKYPPEGSRGCGPRRASMYGRTYSDYVRSANEQVLVVLMIETPTAVQNLDEILSVRGVDAIFVGPDDLSLNLGIFQQREAPLFKNALKTILTACARHKVAPGMHCNDSNISDAIAQGFQFVALNDDDTFLQLGARYSLDKVKGWRH